MAERSRVSAPHDESASNPNPKWNRCNIWLTIAVSILSLLSIALLSILLIHVFNWSQTCTHDMCPEVRCQETTCNPPVICPTQSVEKPASICVTKDCVITASNLIESMDLSADPCEDFYQFACGGFIKRNPVPDLESKVSIESKYEVFYHRQLRDLIESVDTLREPDVVSRAQEAYHVCLNTSHQKDKELKAFQSFMKTELGGWPLVEGIQWKSRWKTVEEFVGKVQRLGISTGFAMFYYGADPRDISRKKIWMLHTSIFEAFKKQRSLDDISDMNGVNDSDEDEDDSNENGDDFDMDNLGIVKAYEKFLSAVAEKLRAPGVIENPLDNLEALMVLLQAMQLKKNDTSVMDDVLNSKEMTIKEMNQISEQKIDWLKILNTRFENIHTFTEDQIIHTNPIYVKEVAEFLKNNSYRSIVSYIIATAMLQLGKHAGPDIEEKYNEMIKEFYGLEVKTERWVPCVDFLQNSYTFAATRLFVNKYVDKQGKRIASEMIESIRNAYRKMIVNSLWLDEPTKRKALRKADEMKQFVSYPDFIFEDGPLESYYEYLPSVNSVHFNNFAGSMINGSIKDMKEFVRPGKIIQHKWTLNPLVINAFYDPGSNSIWFPSGILQLPYFDVTRPAAVNYGIIGAVIGHEIGHGYDNSGRNYDEYGQFRQWWTNDTLKKYQQRTECFQYQYDSFCPKELQETDSDETICVSGTQTLGENIADNSGLRASFQAYGEWVEKHGQEMRLPGLEAYTPEQIFFLSFGHAWCENIPPEKWQEVYDSDEHSPRKYRVIGVLQNQQEFVQAFNCPVGPMNRKDKCILW